MRALLERFRRRRVLLSLRQSGRFLSLFGSYNTLIYITLVSTSSVPIYHEATTSMVEREREERPEGGERGRGEAEVTERGARDVPRRALNTTSSGLGISKANPRREASSGAGGSKLSCLPERLEVSDFELR